MLARSNAVLFLLATTATATAKPLDVLSWNVEGRGGADPAIIAIGPTGLLESINRPLGWVPTCKASVIVRDSDFPGSKATSDHRPVTMMWDRWRVPSK